MLLMYCRRAAHVSMSEPVLPTKCRRTLKGHLGPVHVVRFDKRGDYCMSGGQDRKIYLWNPFSNDEQVLVQTYSGHSWEINDISITHDSKSFASCGGDRQVYLWDSVTGRILRQFQGHHLKVNSVAFNEDSSVLASGSDDKTVRLWDMRAASSRYPIQILEDAKDSIGSVCIRGSMIAVGSVDGCVRMYDIRKGIMNCDNLTESVTSLKLGNDSQCYLASLTNSTIKLMDGPSGKLLNTFKGHKQEKYRLESIFSADESTVLSGSEDAIIYAWDMVTGKVIAKLEGHSGPVVSLAQHPKNNAKLLSASADGTIKLWM